ncbi:MAG TPA: MFS transporter [Nevskiaceae bacterium]|nr:MFS transporter [Nevskiaceae bacterium]
MTRKQRFALFATILGSGIVFLDGAVVNLALPKMGTDLHLGFAGLQWVVDGYALTLSALILLGGSLGDILGRKRVYLWGVTGFAITSFLCGIAPTGALLIALRMAQGIFGALLVPGALALINTNFTAEQRGRAIAQWTAWTAAISAIGPLVGGYLIDVGSWRWIFFINVPLLAICYWLGLGAIKESKDERVRRVDTTGAVLAMLGLGGITYGLIEAPVSQHRLWPLLALGAGIITFLAFVWFEHRNKDPMVDLSLFRSRNFTAANVATLAMYGALGGFFFALIIHLQTVVGFSSLQSGISFLPVTLLLLALSGRVGALCTRFGSRWFMTIGPILAGCGIFLLLPLTHGANYAINVLPGLLLFGLGLALTVTPLTTTVLGAVHQSASGIASAINNAVSRVAGLLVVALLGIFGASHAYRFSALLCGTLAIIAGVLSFALVRNPKKSATIKQ